MSLTYSGLASRRCKEGKQQGCEAFAKAFIKKCCLLPVSRGGVMTAADAASIDRVMRVRVKAERKRRSDFILK